MHLSNSHPCRSCRLHQASLRSFLPLLAPLRRMSSDGDLPRSPASRRKIGPRLSREIIFPSFKEPLYGKSPSFVNGSLINANAGKFRQAAMPQMPPPLTNEELEEMLTYRATPKPKLPTPKEVITYESITH